MAIFGHYLNFYRRSNLDSMKYFSWFFAVFLSASVAGQMNVDSLSHISYQQLHGANLNDVWGYEDELGNEYAIVGTSKGTSIVNVTDPSNPVEVFWYPGTESIWRDPSVYGDFAYVTTEAEDGLLIIDLSPLPQSTNLPTSVYTGPPGQTWSSAHTCFCDNQGFAYVFGSNLKQQYDPAGDDQELEKIVKEVQKLYGYRG